jgi:hypothetical protein
MKTVGGKFDLLKYYSEKLFLPELNPFRQRNYESQEYEIPEYLQDLLNEISADIIKNKNQFSPQLAFDLNLIFEEIKQHYHLKVILPILMLEINSQKDYFNKYLELKSLKPHIINVPNEKIKKKFGKSLEEITNLFENTNIESLSTERILKAKSLENIPMIPKEKIKEAYRFYSTNIAIFLRNLSLQNNTDISLIPIIVQHVMDSVYVKFGINTKNFINILNKHNLFEDPEVIEITGLLNMMGML